MITSRPLSFLLAVILYPASSLLAAEATKPESLDTLPGFRVELVRTADPATEGSWISIAKDPQGRLLVGGERKEPISRLTLKDGAVVKAEILKIPLGEVMGMLFAFDSLYINGRGNNAEGQEIYGLWRTRANAEGEFDKVELLREWKGGGGDHGAHAILLDPDKKHLDVLCGNFVDVPADVLPTSPHRNYADDLVLPRAEDGNGFGAGRKPPGGFVVRMDPDGSHCELMASGERNTYGVAFNHDGELFGFDSDMEWDWGTPWYRPVRVFHAVSGADHGFREGASKWPEYYHDSLPATVTIGIGCPTGVGFGSGAKFPAKYQRAFFIQDWTYGRLMAVHLTPQGASYTGTWENFVAPKALRDKAAKKTPLNLTGLVIGDDGAMYFTTGGRHTQGALYRVTYDGTEPTAPADLHDATGGSQRAIRHQMEAFHGHEDAKAVDAAWPQLGSSDRFLRYAARIAIESQPIEQWKARALAEKDPETALTILVSIARLGGTAAQAELLQALAKFPLAQLKGEALQLEKLRVLEVAISRMGRPAPELAAPLIADLSPAYPAGSVSLNRELCQTLLALNAPSTIERTLKLLAAASTQEEQLNYIVALRTITEGWTPELHRQYFKWWTIKRNATQHPETTLRWFADAGREYSDGASFSNFLVKVRRTAIDKIPQPELAAVQSTLDSWAEPAPKLKASKKKRTTVHDWKLADFEADFAKPSQGRNFAEGQDAVYASQCLMCHRVGEEGGSVGPDLTAIASRFSKRDLLESILDPSKVISEQYANSEIVLKDGKTIIGRVVADEDGKLLVRPSMLAPDMQEVATADIKSREPSKVSPMPPGLLNMLSKDEILDLLAYFEAAGHADGAPFKK